MLGRRGTGGGLLGKRPEPRGAKATEEAEVLAGLRGPDDRHAVRRGEMERLVAAITSRFIKRAITAPPQQDQSGLGTALVSLQTISDEIAQDAADALNQANAAIADAAAAQGTADSAATAAATAQSSANTALDNQSATLSFRVRAGSAGALLDLVASSNPSGSISVARIEAEYVILKGTVALDFLSVGLTQNQCHNANFAKGLAHWAYFETGAAAAETSVAIRAPGATWAGRDFPTLMMFQAGTATTGYSEVTHQRVMADGSFRDTAVECRAGQWLEFSCFVSTHRCTGEMRVQFYDATGATLGAALVTAIGTDPSSSINPLLWPQVWAKHQAPANAAFVTFTFRKNATLSGQADSYMFLSRPLIADTHQFATTPTPWSNGGTTLITGGEIITGAINAEKIAAGAVTAAKVDTVSFAASGLALFGGALQSSNFVAGSAGWRIEDDGDAEFNGATIRGTLQSSNFVAGSTGWRITQAGGAEFNNLITRNQIVNNAVSDKANVFGAGPYQINSTFPTSPTLVMALGTTVPTDLWFVGWALRLWRSSTYYPVIEIRKRTLVGVTWSDWEVLATINGQDAPEGGGAFTKRYGGGEFIVGDFDNTEIGVFGRSLGTGISSQFFLSNVTLTRQKIVK